MSHLNSDIDEDESVEGEDLEENYQDDNIEIEELDKYDEETLDESQIISIDPNVRRRAEEEMDRRDYREGRTSRLNRNFIGRSIIGDNEEDEDDEYISYRNRLQIQQGDENDEIGQVNLEDYQGSIVDILDDELARNEVKRRFRQFLQQFVDPKTNEIKYLPRITRMGRENKISIEIDHNDLFSRQENEQYSILAIWVIDHPEIILKLFDEVAMELVKLEYENYENISQNIHVRLTNVAITDELRDLRQIHLNQFIQVRGVVTRRTNIFPQLRLVKYDCIKCGFILGPYTQVSSKIIKPPSCPDCQSKGPFRINEQSTQYRNYQKIILQESPGSVPAGRIPRSREVILTDDLCDSVRGGELVELTGIYKNIFDADMNIQNGFPIFNTIIEANYIKSVKDTSSKYTITDDDKEIIFKLSKNPNIDQIIVNSIAPSIYGYDYIKRAICYSLFGGQEKKHENKHRVRGDINVLILGDPGVGKSQFLKYVENVASRSVYATGKGASAVGLTASVRRDPMTREWTLEGGALVLADRGICLIDEFDKMNEQDRTSIHEAMEQQSISISKAGIVATLQARCGVIAAANPVKGRYDGSLTFVENVDLTDPILSRFDVLAVVRDKVDPINDEKLANFVVENHIFNHPKNKNNDSSTNNNSNNNNDKTNKKKKKTSSLIENQQISQELLRKYILFAKERCHPKLDGINKDKISKFYGDLRQKSMTGGGIPIAVRHIESILRLSEARARLHFRESVDDNDVDVAISIILKSFIDTQKLSVQASLKAHFSQYLAVNKNYNGVLMHLLHEEIQEECNHLSYLNDNVTNVKIDIKAFEERARAMNITNISKFIKSNEFKEQGFSIITDNRGKKFIQAQFS